MRACVSCALGFGAPDVKSTDKFRKPSKNFPNGGEHVDIRPVKMWGKPIRHPLEIKDEFIWNIEWRPFLDDESQTSPSLPASQEHESSTGFLSFNRVMEIDRIDVDLTKELLNPVERSKERDWKPWISKGQCTKNWRYAPTRNERKQWHRARKAMYSLPGDDKLTALVSTEELEREKYKQLKSKLQLLTVGIGGAGTLCACVVYSPAVALSYGIGLLGSLAYVRMLGNSVDAFGRGDIKGAVSGAVGQPRLLVPVVLTMAFNRWNELLVPEFGITQLQLIPMLIGFFTYKIATVVQVIQDGLSSYKTESVNRLE